MTRSYTRSGAVKVSFLGFMKSWLKRPFTGVWMHLDIEQNENGRILNVKPYFAGKTHPNDLRKK